jgi:hypothetical protein
LCLLVSLLFRDHRWFRSSGNHPALPHALRPLAMFYPKHRKLQTSRPASGFDRKVEASSGRCSKQGARASRQYSSWLRCQDRRYPTKQLLRRMCMQTLTLRNAKDVPWKASATIAARMRASQITEVGYWRKSGEQLGREWQTKEYVDVRNEEGEVERRKLKQPPRSEEPHGMHLRSIPRLRTTRKDN